jgi:hypothetical protein
MLSSLSDLRWARPLHRRKTGDGAHPVCQPRTDSGEIAEPAQSVRGRLWRSSGKLMIRTRYAAAITPADRPFTEEFIALLAVVGRLCL